MASKRVRRSAESWRVLVGKQLESGLTVAAFCARERLSAASFYQWRTRFGGGAAQERAGTSATSGAFVDLGAVGGSGRWELRIDFGGGLVVQLARG